MYGKLNLVDNLAEGIHKIKCKYGYNNKKYEIYGIKCKDSECCLEYTNGKDVFTLDKLILYYTINTIPYYRWFNTKLLKLY